MAGETEEEARWNRIRLSQTLISIAALFGVVGLIAAGAGLIEYTRVRSMAGWPQVEGAVRSVGIEERFIHRGRAPVLVDAVTIAYDYDAAGQSYTGDRIEFDGRPVDPESATGRRLLALAPGAPLTVYFNPDDPAEAVLAREPSTRALVNGSALFALAVLIRLLETRVKK